jgi:DNA helicase-2/ATP-dependent DNA helicase PcrA
LRYRWPFILEDEAQDSSRLQEEILRTLSGPGGNWVRVGDPNQAIYETFTTADPSHLRRFLEEPGVVERELPNSGRSTQSIMDLANYLIDWTHEHPVEEIRDALSLPYIEPTPPGDPQPNPTDRPDQVHLVARKFTPAEELQAVVDSLARWLPEHQEETVAVLVPRNRRGDEVVDALKAHGLACVEFLRSTSSTREAAGALANVINYLADPGSPAKLARIYRVWRRKGRDDEEAKAHMERIARMLRRLNREGWHVEDFLWPRAGAVSLTGWLDGLGVGDDFSYVSKELFEFRTLVRRWQEAALLPVDQLVLTLAQDLFKEPADLAVAHKLAVLLRRASDSHPDWRLPELTDELAVIARNERRFLGLGDEDSGFDPEEHKGQVVVATVHKAKGLEWDRVYLMSVNNYNFPSAQPHDRFIAEKWFIRDNLNLEAEAVHQLEALRQPRDAALFGEEEGGVYEEGQATREARVGYAAERLRLLYVGITRARRELIITWNSGKRGDQQPATPFTALRTFWEERPPEEMEGTYETTR